MWKRVLNKRKDALYAKNPKDTVTWQRMGLLMETLNMAREFAKIFYNSQQWKKCRSAYIAYRKSIDGGLCEVCHEKTGYIVHHKTELTPENINNPDIALGFGNLKYDCLECHNKEHNRNKGEVPGLVQYTFTPEGEVVALPPCLK